MFTEKKPSSTIYLRRERENAILQRVEFTGAEDADIARLAAGESELFVSSKVRVKMTQHTSWLNFNRRHFGDRLNVKSVVSEFISNFIIIGYDDHLHDDL